MLTLGRCRAEVEIPILWPPDVKSRLIGKDLDAGRDWRQKEDELVGWHRQLNGHHHPGDGEGQGSLVCCRPWGGKESDTTGRLNNGTRMWKSPGYRLPALVCCALFLCDHIYSSDFNSCLCKEVFWIALYFLLFISSWLPSSHSKIYTPKWIYSLLANWLIVSTFLCLGQWE